MARDEQGMRVVIVGASSLRGKELKEVLEEGSFAAAEIGLLDEETAAGTLTEAGGEPVVIQTVDEDSFEHARFAFFAGDAAFAAAHWRAAQRAGATVIDLSGGMADAPSSVAWIPALDALLPPTEKQPADAVYIAPPTPVIVGCSAAAALAGFGIERMAIVFLQPVSERGQPGVEELESQTVKLLSFQPIGQEVFGAQVAFNLIDRYGEGSREQLSSARAAIAAGVRSYLEGRVAIPAVQIIQAPVFFATAFSIYAELRVTPDGDALARAMDAAGMRLAPAGETAPSNVSVAGEARIVVGHMERDANVERGWWMWGAADNLRLAASNALQIAEKLLAA